MKGVFTAFLLTVTTVIQAQSEWTKVVLQAWASMPATVQADAEWEQARADKALADLAWMPSLTLGTTPSGAASLGAVQGSEPESGPDRLWSGTLAASASQALPGGGTVTANASRSVAASQESSRWTTTAGLGVSVPLGGADSRRAAVLELQKAELQRQAAHRAAFVSLLKQAAAIDNARADLAWRQSLEQAASERRRTAESLLSQGRLSRVEAAAAQRVEREARWSRINSESTLSRTERDWYRNVKFPLPPLSREDIDLKRSLLPFELVTRPGDEPLYRIELEQTRETDRTERSRDVPVLGWGATITETKARSWSSQVTLTWSPDALIRAGRLDELLRARESRWISLAEAAAKEKKDADEAALFLVGSLGEEIMRREAAHVPLQKTADDLRTAAASGQATTTDVLTAQAEVLGIEAEIRGLRWELALAELGE